MNWWHGHIPLPEVPLHNPATGLEVIAHQEVRDSRNSANQALIAQLRQLTAVPGRVAEQGLAQIEGGARVLLSALQNQEQVDLNQEVLVPQAIPAAQVLVPNVLDIQQPVIDPQDVLYANQPPLVLDAQGMPPQGVVQDPLILPEAAYVRLLRAVAACYARGLFGGLGTPK